ncbi:acyltransferase [Nocardioides sp. Y6]|uniref:Acyltransferase n=1 Tax=Nocardioides malaquae TaxID=2773426 RepID=A0ABR9RTE5_9ACTN|nr:acyltransferase [Nocardioides malaquae]MBE7324811.1 acyltransferase [Nocardioides malaquae]
MDPAHKLTSSRQYMLDPFRFLAAFSVLLYHYTFRGHNGGKVESAPSELLQSITQYGYLGVDGFFLISGVVILHSAHGKSVRQYVASRTSRLYPAFWAAVIFTTVLVCLIQPPWRTIPTVTEFLANLTMVPNLADQAYVEPVYWTLWAELRFYAIVFVLVLIRPTLSAFYYLAAAWTASLYVWWIARLFDAPLPLSLVLQPHAGHYFAGGIAIALAARGYKPRQTILIALATWGLSLLAALDFARTVNNDHGSTLAPIPLVTIVTSIYLLIYMAAGNRRAISSKPAARLKALGSLTFPLYLVHASLGYITINAISPHLGFWPAFLVAVALSLTAAWLIRTLVEDKAGPRMRRAILAKESSS